MLSAFAFYDYWKSLSAASGVAIFGQNVLIRWKMIFPALVFRLFFVSMWKQNIEDDKTKFDFLEGWIFICLVFFSLFQSNLWIFCRYYRVCTLSCLSVCIFMFQPTLKKSPNTPYNFTSSSNFTRLQRNTREICLEKLLKIFLHLRYILAAFKHTIVTLEK